MKRNCCGNGCCAVGSRRSLFPKGTQVKGEEARPTVPPGAKTIPLVPFTEKEKKSFRDVIKEVEEAKIDYLLSEAEFQRAQRANRTGRKY